MRAKIARWGHSLALRVPRHLAREAGLSEGATVDVSACDGHLQVSVVSEPVPSLDDLLAQVTDGNLHAAVETGPARGAEAW